MHMIAIDVLKAHSRPTRLASVPPTYSCATPVAAHGITATTPCRFGVVLVELLICKNHCHDTGIVALHSLAMHRLSLGRFLYLTVEASAEDHSVEHQRREAVFLWKESLCEAHVVKWR